MGVHGLWRLIEPSGNAVPLETLENKVLAVGILYFLQLVSIYNRSFISIRYIDLDPSGS